MNSEYIITIDEVRLINKRYGGSVRTDAAIETALMRGKGRGVYRKIAYLLRAILVGHPFTDGNKRTALMVALAILEKVRIVLNERQMELMVEQVTKIARENIEDIKRIERLIRYATEVH